MVCGDHCCGGIPTRRGREVAGIIFVHVGLWHGGRIFSPRLLDHRAAGRSENLRESLGGLYLTIPLERYVPYVGTRYVCTYQCVTGLVTGRFFVPYVFL